MNVWKPEASDHQACRQIGELGGLDQRAASDQAQRQQRDNRVASPRHVEDLSAVVGRQVDRPPVGLEHGHPVRAARDDDPPGRQRFEQLLAAFLEVGLAA